MGSWITTHIVYGYDLGGSDSWLIKELGEYDSLIEGSIFQLVMEPEEDEEEVELEEFLLDKLEDFRIEDHRHKDDYFELWRAAQANMLIDVHMAYVQDYYSSYILGVEAKHESHGSLVLDIPEDLFERDMTEVDAKLEAAMAALEVTPLQDKPKWMLTASYG